MELFSLSTRPLPTRPHTSRRCMWVACRLLFVIRSSAEHNCGGTTGWCGNRLFVLLGRFADDPRKENPHIPSRCLRLAAERASVNGGLIKLPSRKPSPTSCILFKLCSDRRCADERKSVTFFSPVMNSSNPPPPIPALRHHVAAKPRQTLIQSHESDGERSNPSNRGIGGLWLAKTPSNNNNK
jgi:hypothetical protein